MGSDPGAPLPLRRLDLWAVIAHSYFFQTLWNFQRMQSLGWLFSLMPALRRLYRDRNRLCRVALEHLEYFNTHPSLVTVIMGVTVAMEEKRAAGEAAEGETVIDVRRRLSGPIAALGETLFGATLRPLLAVAAVSFGFQFLREGWWVVPLLFLIVGNTCHLWARTAGFWAGYRQKTDVVASLMRINPQRIAQGASLVGVGISLGAFLVLWASFGPGRWTALVLTAGAVAVQRFGMTPTPLLYFMVAAVLVAKYAGF